MHNKEFELHVIPSESRIAESETNSYTLRLPMTMLLTKDLDLEQVLADTGNVAFGHNKPDSKTVVVNCPEGAEKSVEWIRQALQQFDVQIRAQEWKRFVDINTLESCSIGCVDRRLDDTGVNNGQAQITHAGGPLVLDPKLKGEMPAAHRVNLIRAMEQAAGNGAPVASLNYHFGAEGASGCGMYGVLSKANPKIREELKDPQAIIDMLNRIRDHYARILSPNTEITGAVLLGSCGNSVVYDLDDPEEVKILFSEKDLVL